MKLNVKWLSNFSFTYIARLVFFINLNCNFSNEKQEIKNTSYHAYLKIVLRVHCVIELKLIVTVAFPPPPSSGTTSKRLRCWQYSWKVCNMHFNKYITHIYVITFLSRIYFQIKDKHFPHWKNRNIWNCILYAILILIRTVWTHSTKPNILIFKLPGEREENYSEKKNRKNLAN